MQLNIEHLSKTYANGVKALDNINLELGPGMFGLLGPNGAGKSSLMRTIATLQRADQGRIHFNGKEIFQHRTAFRKSLGYLPQDFGVYPKDSAEQLLHYLAVLKGINAKKQRQILVEEVLAITNLSEVKKKRVSTFSGGMKQRFGIAQVLLNRPKLIIVDEPTAGLDPAERTRFLNVLRGISSENIVIFSTHLVQDVRELCNQMAILNKGSLQAKIAPKVALAKLNGKIWETTISSEMLKELKVGLQVLSTHYNDQHQLVHRVYADLIPSSDFTPCAVKLEDYYFLSLN